MYGWKANTRMKLCTCADELKLRILRMFDGTFSLEDAKIIMVKRKWYLTICIRLGSPHQQPWACVSNAIFLLQVFPGCLHWFCCEVVNISTLIRFLGSSMFRDIGLFCVSLYLFKAKTTCHVQITLCGRICSQKWNPLDAKEGSCTIREGTSGCHEEKTI